MTTNELYGFNFPRNTEPSSVYESPTLSDTVDLPFPTREICIGTGGTLVVKRLDDVTVTIPASIATDGARLSIRAKRILSTGTTASNIVVLY